MGKESDTQDVLWEQLCNQPVLGVAQAVMERFHHRRPEPRLGIHFWESDEGWCLNFLQDTVGIHVQQLAGEKKKA